MDYEMMIPPFKHVQFVDMNKQEAQQYFEWYISQVQHRIDVLDAKIKQDVSTSVIDYSVDSLIPLWEWYEQNIQIVNKSPEQYIREISEYPDWMASEISKSDISLQTLKYGLDISMYFAELVIRNSAGKIAWGYFNTPKKRKSVNEPTLLGFKNNMDLNPRLIILNCTRGSSRQKLATRLFDVYNTWMEFIE